MLDIIEIFPFKKKFPINNNIADDKENIQIENEGDLLTSTNDYLLKLDKYIEYKRAHPLK